MRNNFLIIIFFILLSLIATYPLLFNFSTHLYGEPKDSLVTVWHFWWLNYAREHKLSQLVIPFIAAPYGGDMRLSPYYPVWNFINMKLTSLAGEIAAYNLQILFGFILSGLFMYHLIYQLIKSRIAALVSGMIFTLSPYHFAHAFEHLGLSNMQWLVLYILSIFNLIKKPTYRNAFFCGLCFALVGFFDYYYLYFSAIFTGLFLLFYIFYYRKEFKNKALQKIKFFLISILVSSVMLLPAIYHIIKSLLKKQDATTLLGTAYVRPFGQLFADSAKLLNYFLPASFHPILGYITRPFIGSFLYGDNPPEQTLYLGIVGLILAFIGFKQWRKKRRELGQNYKSSEENFIISFFIFSFFAFIIISFSPYVQIGKIFIPFPSFFLYKVFPMFRNYARMGVLVLISMCVLAGFGLKYIIEKIKTEKKKIFLTSALSLLIFFEFLPYPPFRMVDATKIPAVYEWLKKQTGDFIIAEYPIDADERPYLFYQRVHEKRLVNGAVPGTYAFEVREKILDLKSPTTAGILEFLGTKYVLVHKDRYLAYEGGAILGKLPDLSNHKGYQLIKRFSDIDMYAIKAQAIDPDIVSVSPEPKVDQDERVILSPRQDMEFAYRTNDELRYLVKYMWLIPAFRLDILVGEENKDKGLVKIKANIYTTRFFSKFLEVKAGILSYFDKVFFCTRHYQEVSWARGHKLHIKNIIYDQESQVMYTEDKAIKIYPYTQDSISSIFFLSSQHFKPEKPISVYINAGKSNYVLEGEIIAKEKIGFNKKIRQCWKIDTKLFKIKDEKKEMAKCTLWFEDSEKKPLLLLNAATKLGWFKLKLLENGKNNFN